MHFLAGGNLHMTNLDKILNTLGYNLKLAKIVPFNKTNVFLQKRVRYSEKVLLNFCKKNEIKFLAIFGSVLREDFTQDSDIDLLIEFGKPVDFFELASIEDGLRKIFKTDHNLDIVTVKSISPLLVEEITKNREVIYEKAA